MTLTPPNILKAWPQVCVVQFPEWFSVVLNTWCLRKCVGCDLLVTWWRSVPVYQPWVYPHTHHGPGCLCLPALRFFSPLPVNVTRWSPPVVCSVCWRCLGQLRLLLSCFQSCCPVCPPECFSTRSSPAMSAHRGDTTLDSSKFRFVYCWVTKKNKLTLS